MRYALIDNDGELHVKDGSYEQARAEVGPEGWDRVRLPQTEGYSEWTGWVNDDGHRLKLPRNIVGGLVLTGLGAALMPYAGPVVLTGWDLHGQSTEVHGLDDLQVRAITALHCDACRAMAGTSEPWAADARRLAEGMRTAPAPGLTIRNIGDFFLSMGGGA